MLNDCKDDIPRRVVAKNASSPGEVDRSNFMLRASSMVQMKNGVQHTRKHTENRDKIMLNILFLPNDKFLPYVQYLARCRGIGTRDAATIYKYKYTTHS